MSNRIEKALSVLGVERWDADMDVQRNMLLNSYNQSLMDGGTPVWILGPDGKTLAVVVAGPIPEAS